MSDAIGEGRLSIEEGVQRIDAVLRSRHRHEIGTLLADLPTRTPATISRPLAAAPPRLGLLAVAAVVIVAAMLVQVLVGLWELWPVGVVALGGATLLPRRSTPVVRARLTPLVHAHTAASRGDTAAVGAAGPRVARRRMSSATEGMAIIKKTMGYASASPPTPASGAANPPNPNCMAPMRAAAVPAASG